MMPQQPMPNRLMMPQGGPTGPMMGNAPSSPPVDIAALNAMMAAKPKKKTVKKVAKKSVKKSVKGKSIKKGGK
jgi:hypothetical protein